MVVHRTGRVTMTCLQGSRLAALAALALLGLAAAACGGNPKTPAAGAMEPDKFLWERGTEALNAQKWLKAREYFRQLVDSYPQSEYRADGKLGVADSYLGERTTESRVLAANEYREYLSFYPTHRRADYGQFRLGMAYFYQMHAAQRDQTETKQAIAELSKFVERYPGSSLFAEGKQRLREARDRLADSEYRVGYFYYRTQKWYPGAIDRFLALLKNDPEYTNRDAVYFYLAQSLVKMSRPAEALPYLDRLLTEFKESAFLAEAEKTAAALKAEMAKKAGV